VGFLDRLRGGGDEESARVAGVALIRESDPLGNVIAGPSTPLDMVTDHFGSRRHRLVLEVRLPGRDPYTVHGEWKVPNRSLGALGGGGILAAGMELPVRVDVDEPQSVDIDWDAYKATPGRKEAQKAAQETRRTDRVREQLERNPKHQQRLREGNRQAVHAWAGAVLAGNMSREEFEQTVQVELDSGRMDPADAEAARASLG
jgi:hypothetical protein